jgi:solute carrier family 25 2-oxodicarboxylate transporter 21
MTTRVFQSDQAKNSYGLSYVAGSLSGIIEVSVSHPIDRIKTEMQTLALTNSNSSIRSAVRNIYNSGGIKGFYSGIIPRLFGIIPMRLTYWGTMKTMNGVTKHQNAIVQYFVPGIVTGCVQTIIDNPIEVLKVKLMTGAKTVKMGNLYDGFTPCMIRNIMFAVPVCICTNVFGTEHPFIAGATGGFVGSMISQPFDVIKTEIQRYSKDKIVKSQKEIFMELYHKNPISLWSGVTMRATLGCVNMGVGFFVLGHIYDFLCDKCYY